MDNTTLTKIQNVIKTFYKDQGRNLPWRKEGISAYEVWVSEIMLQQTQVSRVIDYFNRFIKKYPTVVHLAKSTWEDFLPYYQGLGYYRRGQNMLKTAKLLVDIYEGVFPQTKKELIQLPGIGEYTASAILSFAYKKDVVAFDTNLQKVFGRILFGNKKAKIITNEIEKNINIPSHFFNAGVMDFSNIICTTKPKCIECPLQKLCRYYSEKGENEVVLIKPQSIFPTKNAQVFLFLHKEHQEYYSPNPDNYECFKLPPQINTRAQIKAYFQDKYQLTLAVRPPHKKVFIEGLPTLFMNAQILLGEHEFGIFSKNNVKSMSFY